MDFQTALICLCVFVASAVVVYLISVIGIKERTFEEAIQEQKRRSQEEVVLSKTEKPKKEKKYKKWSRQKKEKNNEKYQDDEPLVEKCNSHDHVEFKSEIEIIAESDNESKLPKTKKHKPMTAKPIVTKKEEKHFPEPVLEDSSKIDDNEKEISKLENIPKEVVDESKRTSETYFIKESNQADEIKTTRETQLTESELVKEAPVSLNAPKKKKAKLEHFENSDVISGSKLLNLVKNAILTDMEVQTLINFLLNKQGDSSGWMKKNDPVTTLKKQLQEKELALEVEQKQTQAATSKLREIRKELNQEKSKLMAAEQTSRDKIAQLQQEIQALQTRMKTSHEQHITETSTMQNKLQQLQAKLTESSDDNAKLLKDKSSLENTLSNLENNLKRLEIDNKNSTEEIAKLQTELKEVEEFKKENERKDKDYQTVQKSKEKLEEQNRELKERLQELITSHEKECQDLQQKLSSTNTQLKCIEKTYSVIDQELKDKKSICSDLETDNNTLKHRLQAMESIVKDREQELKKLQSSLEEACVQRTELESRLEQLQFKLEELTKSQEEEIHSAVVVHVDHENLCQFPSVGERTSAEGEEAPHHHQNGDVHQEVDNKNSQKKVLELSEYERIIEEKEAALERLWDEVNQHKSTIATVSEELAIQKKKNNELREKNWKAMEALSSAEKTAESKIEQLKKEHEENLIKSQKETEIRIEEVKKQFENNKMEENCVQKLKESKEKAEESLKTMEQRLRDQNLINEERLIQVEKLQHRLQELETSTDKKTKELNNDFDVKIKAEQKREQELLQRIFPDIKVDEQLEHLIWVSHFEREALNILGRLKCSSTDETDDSLRRELEDMKTQLISLKEEKEKTVQHYKTVLAETEDILNKLQNSVENEEMEWKKMLKIKEQELEKVNKENKELFTEKKKLEINLQQLQGVEETTSEMQAKLKELQVKLEGEETERKLVKEKLEEANQSALKFKDEIDAKSKEIENLRKEINSFENTKKEYQQIKVQLEKERKITKDLSAQTVKLSSLVKIGQDALRAEQETVKELQAQLQSIQNTNLNGPGNLPRTEEYDDVSVKK